MTVSGSRAQRHDAPWRVFIALWPSAAAARQLAVLTNERYAVCGGRKIPVANQHLTLAFLGNLLPQRIGEVEAVMHGGAGPSFELRLNTLEYRKRGGLWWVRATVLDPTLCELVQRLRVLLAACNLPVEQRRFVPHVTLLREARPCTDGRSSVQVTWPAQELTLVRSHLERQGVRYEVMHRVALVRRAESVKRQRDAGA